MELYAAIRTRKSVRSYLDQPVEQDKLDRILEAATILACCAETDRHRMRCGHECFLIDVAIATDHITLAATAEGLGTCWIGAFDANEVRRILGIPSGIEVVELMPLGYPSDPAPVEKSRRALAEIVRYDSW